MSVIRRILVIAAMVGVAGGVANLHAQTVLGDPKDAARTFSSNCSACHKSPQGLAKSGQVAGFLRQHYTTGPEMSAAMAAYLVAAGAAPASKKGAEKGAETAAARGKKDAKQEPKQQLSAVPPTAGADGTQKQTLRGKQRQQKGTDSQTSSVQQPDHAVQRPVETPAAERKQATPQAAAAQTAAAPATAVQTTPAAPSTPAAPEMMVLDVPLPAMPDAPPPELTQSAFSSSPLP